MEIFHANILLRICLEELYTFVNEVATLKGSFES